LIIFHRGGSRGSCQNFEEEGENHNESLEELVTASDLHLEDGIEYPISNPVG